MRTVHRTALFKPWLAEAQARHAVSTIFTGKSGENQQKWVERTPCLLARQKSGLDFGREGKARFLLTHSSTPAPKKLHKLIQIQGSWDRGRHVIFHVLLNTYYLRWDPSSLMSPPCAVFLCCGPVCARRGGTHCGQGLSFRCAGRTARPAARRRYRGNACK